MLIKRCKNEQVHTKTYIRIIIQDEFLQLWVGWCSNSFFIYQYCNKDIMQYAFVIFPSNPLTKNVTKFIHVFINIILQNETRCFTDQGRIIYIYIYIILPKGAFHKFHSFQTTISFTICKMCKCPVYGLCLECGCVMLKICEQKHTYNPHGHYNTRGFIFWKLSA